MTLREEYIKVCNKLTFNQMYWYIRFWTTLLSYYIAFRTIVNAIRTEWMLVRNARTGLRRQCSPLRTTRHWSDGTARVESRAVGTAFTRILYAIKRRLNASINSSGDRLILDVTHKCRIRLTMVWLELRPVPDWARGRSPSLSTV